MWSRTLEDIGYRDGVSMAVGEDKLTVFWAVPVPARAGHGLLTLQLATFRGPTPATAAVLVDGTPVAALDLPAGAGTQALTLELPAKALADGIVRLDIVPPATQTCTDGPHITALPQSALTLDVVPPPSLEARLALLPHRVALALPHGPLSQETYRNVAVIAAALARDGHRVVFRAPVTAGADIRLTAAGTALAATDDGPLVIPATQPIAETIAAPHAAPLPVDDTADPAIALTALSVLPAAQMAAPRATWTFALPLAALPQGLWPRAVMADVTAPVDGTGARQALTLEINDQLVASTLLPIGGDARRVTLPIPRGALNATNAIRLTLTRVGLDKLCAQSPLPVSLGPGALVTLGTGAAAPEQFFELAHGPEAGAALWLTPEALTDPTASLPLVLALMTHTVRDLRALTLHLTSEGFAASDAPFLYLGPNAPPGLGALTLPDHAPDATFAALVAIDGTTGIWLRPGADAPAHMPALERGRFATLNAAGDLVWSNGSLTTRRLVLSAQSEELARFVKRYWPWTAALLWLAATGGTLIAVARRRKDP